MSMAKSEFIQGGVKSIIEVGAALVAGYLAYIFFTGIYPLYDGHRITYLYPYGAALLTAGVVYLITSFFTRFNESGIERGEEMLPGWKIKLISWRKTRNDPKKFYWGGLYLPFKSGNLGLAAVGAPGSGKTVSIRLFMQSVLPHVGETADHRAIIYDAKSEMMPILAGIGIDTDPESGRVKILNPYDNRSYYWEMWRDIEDTEETGKLALLFVPVTTGKDEMWTNRARSLLTVILDCLILSGKAWTLRDLCAATMSEERIKAVLEATPKRKKYIDSFLGKGRATDGVIFELQSSMEKFHGIAGLWDSMPEDRGISLTKWLENQNGSILLLGAAEDGTPLGSINKLIIARLGQLIKFQSNDTNRRTWIIIDELRQCGRLDLSAIATTGRQRGASLVIGYQDNHGLRDAYGEDSAEELLGMCQHKAIFRLSSASTAEDAAKVFNTQDVLDKNGQERTRHTVSPSEFMANAHIPETNIQNGLTGYYKSISIGAYKLRLNGNQLFYGMLLPLNEEAKGLDRKNPNPFPFEDWIETDLIRLGYIEKKLLPLPTPIAELDLAEKDDDLLFGIGRTSTQNSNFKAKKPFTDEELERGIQDRG